MAFVEINDTNVELDSSMLSGVNLSFARDDLKRFLTLKEQSPEGYTDNLIDYLNAIQGHYFLGEAHDIRPMETRSANAVSLILKNEVECIFGESIEPVEDVQLRLKGNLNDEFAEIIEDAGCSTLPRAVTMTLFELIEDYR